jgi:hypothetical protein
MAPNDCAAVINPRHTLTITIDLHDTPPKVPAICVDMSTPLEDLKKAIEEAVWGKDEMINPKQIKG